MEVENEPNKEQRLARHRHVAEPVVLEEEDEDMSEIKESMDDNEVKEESENEDDVDEDERTRRRLELKKKALQRQEVITNIVF